MSRRGWRWRTLGHMHDLVATGDAARLLGVGTSSLRAWADGGSIECVRTPGGHRRFRVHDLAAWLEAHGAHMHGPEARTMVDGRLPPSPHLAAAIRDRQQGITVEAQVLFGAGGSTPTRGNARREQAVRDAVATLRHGIQHGDLRDACRRSAWLAYCAAVLGRSSRDVLAPGLAAGRATARAMRGAGSAQGQQVAELAMDRWASCIAAGYAAGLAPPGGAAPAPEPSHGPGRWLALEDAARSLGVSRSTLRDWCDTTDIPHVRTAGGHRRFDPVDLRTWVAGRPDVMSRRRGTWPTIPRNADAAAFVGEYGPGIARLAGLPFTQGHAWVSAATDGLATGSLARARRLGAGGFTVANALAMERALDMALARADAAIPRNVQVALLGAAQALVVLVTDHQVVTPHSPSGESGPIAARGAAPANMAFHTPN